VNTLSTPEMDVSVSNEPSVQLHTPAIGGQSIFDTIKRSSMKGVARTAPLSNPCINKSLDAVFASQASGVDTVVNSTLDEVKTLPVSQPPATTRPCSVRPRCIRMLTPRINIQVLKQKNCNLLIMISEIS
jgi:hypothetical protein